MPAIAFDTLKFANKLKEAGVPDKQAEAQSAIMAEALQVNLDNLATKEQVEGTKELIDRQGVDLRKEIDLLRSDMTREFQLVRQENGNTKNELLQAIAHNETRQNGQIQLLRWMVTACLTLLTGVFIRIMFFRIN